MVFVLYCVCVIHIKIGIQMWTTVITNTLSVYDPQDPLLNMTQSVFGGDDNIFQNFTDAIPHGLLDYDKMGWFYKVTAGDDSV